VRWNSHGRGRLGQRLADGRNDCREQHLHTNCEHNGTASGSFVNTTGNVSSTNGGTGNTATANLSVATPPTITKVLRCASIPLNGSTSLSFTITNPAINTIR